MPAPLPGPLAARRGPPHFPACSVPPGSACPFNCRWKPSRTRCLTATALVAPAPHRWWLAVLPGGEGGDKGTRGGFPLGGHHCSRDPNSCPKSWTPPWYRCRGRGTAKASARGTGSGSRRASGVGLHTRQAGLKTPRPALGTTARTALVGAPRRPPRLQGQPRPGGPLSAGTQRVPRPPRRGHGPSAGSGRGRPAAQAPSLHYALTWRRASGGGGGVPGPEGAQQRAHRRRPAGAPPAPAAHPVAGRLGAAIAGRPSAPSPGRREARGGGAGAGPRAGPPLCRAGAPGARRDLDLEPPAPQLGLRGLGVWAAPDTCTGGAAAGLVTWERGCRVRAAVGPRPSRLTSLSASVLVRKMGLRPVKGVDCEPRTAPGLDSAQVQEPLGAYNTPMTHCLPS